MTGYIGGRLAPKLLDAGYGLRCLVRSPRKLEGRGWETDPHVEIRKADLSDRPSLTLGLSGCDAAFYLVHSMMSTGPEYAKQDLALALTFAAAARDAGVGRIIYLGGLGETGPGLSEHLASRRNVETALASAGVPVTVLRAAMIIGSGSASFEILRYLVQRLPVMVTPKWVSTACQPIAIENVIAYLVGAHAVTETTGQVFDIGGPQILCYRDIMQIMAEELGLRRRWIIPVPFLSPSLSSRWINLITPLSARIARPLAEGLKNEVVCREDRITRLIPQTLLDVRQAIHSALSQVKSHLVETNWSMAGQCQAIPTGRVAPSFVTSAKPGFTFLHGLSFVPCAGWAGRMAGTPVGFGNFVVGLINWLAGRACVAVDVIQIASAMATRWIFGESSALSQIAR